MTRPTRFISGSWRRRAAALGLTAESPVQAVGRVEGLPVTVTAAPRTAGFSVRVGLAGRLPDGARATLSRAGGLQWKGPEPDMRWLLDEAGVRVMAEELTEHCQRATAEEDRLRLEVDSTELDRALPYAVAFVRALQERRQSAVHRLVERIGFTDPLTVASDSVEGVADGVKIWVMLPFVDGKRWACTVRAQLPDPLPPETLIVPSFLGVGDEEELGDLFLDTALHVRTSDPDALKARLARDAVRGPLLETLCENPGSRLTTDSLIAIRWTGALAVDERLEELLQLLRAMGPER